MHEMIGKYRQSKLYVPTCKNTHPFMAPDDSGRRGLASFW